MSSAAAPHFTSYVRNGKYMQYVDIKKDMSMTSPKMGFILDS